MQLRSRPSRVIGAAITGLALMLGAAACATGPAKSDAGPTTSHTTSSSPSTTSPSTTSTTSAAPTTTAEPTPANQPAVVYVKGQSTSAVGEQVSISVRVETPNPGIPFGDVSLLVNGAAIGTVTLDAEGNAAFMLPELPAGDHTYQATFAGNLEYVAAQSTTKTLTVMTQEQIAAKKAEEEAKKKAEQEAAAAGNPCPASARACVDLTNNKTWIQENGVVVYGPVAQIAGRKGYRTPPGTFTVQWKDIDHLSSQFDDAPMPYSIFFNGGIAFHQGSLSNPSHGCIHLSQSAAAAYWDYLAVGDVVYVFGAASTY